MKQSLKRRAFIIASLPVIARAALLGGPGDGALEGTVRDEKGRPVAGASLKAQHAVRRETASATSNAQGDYLIEPLSPGVYSLYVSRRGYCSLWIRQVNVAAGQRTRKDIVLPSDEPCPVP